MFYLFMADGTEEVEAIATLDVMRRAGIEVKTVGVGSDIICGSHGIKIICDMSACETVLDSSLEGVVIPGGMPGTVNLENDKYVIDAVKYCADNSKLLCAICAAPSVFGHLGLLEGKKAVCFPGFEQFSAGTDLELNRGKIASIQLSPPTEGDFRLSLDASNIYASNLDYYPSKNPQAIVSCYAVFAPVALEAAGVSSKSACISWEMPFSDSPVTGFAVYRNQEYLADTVETIFYDTDLDPDTEYTYTVVDSKGKEKEVTATYEDGMVLYLKSGYRSYQTQETMYFNRLEKNNGKDFDIETYNIANMGN